MKKLIISAVLGATFFAAQTASASTIVNASQAKVQQHAVTEQKLAGFYDAWGNYHYTCGTVWTVYGWQNYCG